MIKILGAGRLFSLVVLVVLVAALAAAHYLVLLPHQEKTERSLRNLEGQISTRQTEVQALKDEFQKLDEVKFKYNELLKFGFFNEQDRVFAREKIIELQKQSGVISAKYEISPAAVEANLKMDEAQYDLVKSPMSFKVESYDDKDVFKFMYLLNYGFPGQISVRSMDMKRIRDVSVPVLQGIGSGSRTSLVEANFEVDWYTTVPKPPVPQTPEGGQQ